MLLNVFERLLLRNIIPQIQGWDYDHMKEAWEFIGGLFSEQEKTDLQIKQEGVQVQWRVAKEDDTPIPQERDILISEDLKAKISEFLKQLSKEKKLGFEHMTLYGKFVEDKPAQ